MVKAIISHRIANNIDASRDKEQVWIELEEHICNSLRGRRVLWAYCETTIKMPIRPQRRPPPGPAQTLLFGGTSSPAPPPALKLTTTTQANGTGKKAGCKTCGGRKKAQAGS